LCSPRKLPTDSADSVPDSAWSGWVFKANSDSEAVSLMWANAAIPLTSGLAVSAEGSMLRATADNYQEGALGLSTTYTPAAVSLEGLEAKTGPITPRRLRVRLPFGCSAGGAQSELVRVR
jgi:hypothetical protein